MAKKTIAVTLSDVRASKNKEGNLILHASDDTDISITPQAWDNLKQQADILEIGKPAFKSVVDEMEEIIEKRFKDK